ncbi:hypothetical protein CSOJ01_15130 [Colletotrichum sojae]|uniref:Uncharacterized protein n=1 Tax=Colletotrichum sojae TaxID=2175907 RepID=A0A8H6IN91_9PEZI|nr:hypothetical protein CSOJ01_15130 [Colletotrichum sojae]
MENQQHKSPALRRQISRKPVPTAQASKISQPCPTEPAKEPLLPSQPEDNSSQGFSPQCPSSSADISTHKSEGKEQQNIDSGENRPREGSRLKPGTWRIIKGWWQELACCCLGVASFAALVVVLQKFDGQPPPNWPLGLTINAAIAALSTISRIALAIPITEGLAQAKWAWFKKRPRPLRDFDAFEQASRGIWGSLMLVVRTNGWLLSILAAIVLNSTVATSTITQSAVTYPIRNIDISLDGSAIAWRLAVGGSAVSNSITYVTDFIHQDEEDENRYNLPNNISARKDPGRNRQSWLWTYFVGLGTPLSHPELNSTCILSYFALQMRDNTADAAEVSLYWCVHTYSAKVVDNVLLMNMTSSESTPSVQSSRLTITPPGESIGYEVPVGGNGVITDHVNRTMTGTSSHYPGTPVTGVSGSDMFAQAHDDVEAEYGARLNGTITADEQRIWWDAVDGMARNVAAGLTNSLLNNTPNVHGTAFRSQTYVQVRLPWLALLGAQVVLSLIILLVIIIETATADVDIVKSSALPSLFAISAEEKANLECGAPKGDSGSGGNDCCLAPVSIDGQFKRKENRWILDG